jgi:hypothetical protein
MHTRWVCLGMFACVATAVATAQGAGDVTLTLASKDGRTQFRQGEAIELQLKFQSSVPGKYGVWGRDTYRTARKAEYDQFAAEPASGTADPLADIFAQFPGGAYVGPPPAPVKIDGAEVAVNLFLNKRISFRQPGHYRVTAVHVGVSFPGT